MFLRITAVMILIVFATPAYADKCGKGNRVSMPSCAHVYISKIAEVKDRSWSIANRCDFDITYKVDVRVLRDKRKTVRAGGNSRGRIDWPGTIRNIKCCPRYNRCR